MSSRRATPKGPSFRGRASRDPPTSIATMARGGPPQALVVMLVWPKGVDHHVLGAFVFKLMGELGA